MQIAPAVRARHQHAPRERPTTIDAASPLTVPRPQMPAHLLGQLLVSKPGSVQVSAQAPFGTWYTCGSGEQPTKQSIDEKRHQAPAEYAPNAHTGLLRLGRRSLVLAGCAQSLAVANPDAGYAHGRTRAELATDIERSAGRTYIEVVMPDLLQFRRMPGSSLMDRRRRKPMPCPWW
jgi:hypothetical protein